MIKKIFLVCSTLVMLTACSQQQVVSGAIGVAKLPVKAAGAVVGTAGGIVGGTVGGVVAGNTGAKYGKMAGQSAARRVVP